MSGPKPDSDGIVERIERQGDWVVLKSREADEALHKLLTEWGIPPERQREIKAALNDDEMGLMSLSHHSFATFIFKEGDSPKFAKDKGGSLAAIVLFLKVLLVGQEAALAAKLGGRVPPHPQAQIVPIHNDALADDGKDPERWDGQE